MNVEICFPTIFNKIKFCTINSFICQFLTNSRRVTLSVYSSNIETYIFIKHTVTSTGVSRRK